MYEVYKIYEVSDMRYYLAPMEGITGQIFRRVYDSCFPTMDKYFAPFVSPNKNGKLSPREQRELEPDNNQGLYVVPQILTNSSTDFIRTARVLQSMGYQEVNLNLGCPSGTVVSKKRGAGFLAYPDQVDQCLHEIFSALDMRISVKTRLGMEKPEEFEHLLEIYNQYPINELIIHPRVRTAYYRNKPHMESFRLAVRTSPNPLCYNGDIFCGEDLRRIKEEFPGLEAVMLGRGIIANPGLLCQDVREAMTKKLLREFHDRLYEEYCREFLASSGQKVVLFKMKEIWCYLLYAFENGEKAGKKIKKAQRTEDYEAAVSFIFHECPLISGGGFRGTP